MGGFINEPSVYILVSTVDTTVRTRFEGAKK